MSVSQAPDDQVNVTLVSSGSRSGIAAGQLARHFDLSIAAAETLLAAGRGVVTARMVRSKAGPAVALLATLGVQLAIQPVGADAVAELFDVSLRLIDPRFAGAVAQKLRDLGYLAGDDLPDFHGPGGLELCDLTQSRAEELVLAMRSQRRAEAVQSPQAEARYDSFAGPRLDRSRLAQVLKHLADIGHPARHPWPALAVGLDRRTIAHINHRFPDHGLIWVNQCFQRYDLTLTGLGELCPRDFADFLTMRGHAPPLAFDALTRSRGLRLDSALTRSAARQFVADYAAIGLQVRVDFVHSAEKTVKMA